MAVGARVRDGGRTLRSLCSVPAAPATGRPEAGADSHRSSLIHPLAVRCGAALCFKGSYDLRSPFFPKEGGMPSLFSPCPTPLAPSSGS